MKKFLILILLGVSLYYGAKVYLHWTRPMSDSATRVSVTIPRGTSVHKISEILEEKELIQDAFTFRLYARKHKLTDKFQAGEYVILRNLTYAEIAEIIQTGKTAEIRVTIPEGSTIKQIDDILASKSVITAGSFTECAQTCHFSGLPSSLEGYLFPSTYFVNTSNFSSKQFISRLHNTFTSQLSDHQDAIKASGRTLDEIVIMASMIEREAFGDNYEEKQKIAGVLWKRLDERIHLGVDATTRYELNEWKRPLYTEDFAQKTPYNTRKNYGLPPTAISNPGIDSLRAAIYPVETEFYYYLHDRSGQIHFGRDLEHHNRNKAKYLY